VDALLLRGRAGDAPQMILDRLKDCPQRLGMRQNIVAADLVIQSVEAIASLRLRFRATA
jgi:hypothetical protein